MPNNNINFQINYQKGDTSALDSLRKELMELKSLTSNLDFNLDKSEIQSFIGSITAVERALNGAFDVNLNTINIQKFNQLLAQSGMNLTTIRQGLGLAGAEGDKVFLSLTSQLMKFNTATKQTNKFLDSIANSFFNTIKYSIFNTMLNSVMKTVQSATGYVKSLDTSLNDIRIVTGKSADEMERFAESANAAAKQLAVTTSDYTEGSLIYYQQGLDDETVKTLTDITAMTSNVTGQSMETVSEQLTAVWNGYQVANQAAKEGMDVYQEYVDKMAAVGATTASDLEELATAMSKVASAASSMGVNFDDLAAQIATIVSVTRQAPESVGTALKTIYARLGDLSVDGVDEFGTSLGSVSSQLQVMGIQILDTNGEMRDMSSVMAEVASKWDTWTSAQKQAAAVAMAGKRQYNNLIALFDNWDMYGEALETSMNAAGTLEKQQEIALDSLANKMDILKATSEDFYDSLLDENSIKKLIEGLTKVIQLLADFADATGGLNTLLPTLASTVLMVFNQQIANGLSTVIINMRTAKSETEMAVSNAEKLKAIFHDSNLYVQTGDSSTEQARIEGLKQLESVYSRLSQYQSLMNQEEKEQYNNIINLTKESGELGIKLQEEKNAWTGIVNSSTRLSELYKDNISDASKLAEMASEFKKLSEDISKTKALQFTDETSNTQARKAIREAFEGDAQRIILEQFNRATGTAKERIQQVIEKLRELGISSAEINKLTAGMENAKSSSQALAKVLEQNLSTKQMVANISNTIGAVGQLASGISMLQHSIDILNNKDLTIDKKIIQVLMNAGMTFSLFSNSFKKLGVLTDVNISKLENLVTAKELDTAATNAEKLAIEANNAAIEAEIAMRNAQQLEDEESIFAEEMLSEAEAKELIAQEAQNKADEANLALTKLTNKAKTEAIMTSKGFSIAKLKESVAILTGKRELEKENAELMINTALKNIALTVTLALVAAIIASIKIREKQIEQQIELNKQELENIKTKEEEVKANQDLIKSYKDLLAQQQKGENVQQSLYEAAMKVARAYDIQGASVLATKGYYEELTAQIKEAQLQESKVNAEQALKGATKASEDVIKEASGGTKKGLVGNKKVTYSVAPETSNMSVITAFTGQYYNNETAQAAKEIGLGTGYNWSVDYTDPVAVKKFTEQVDYMVEYTKESGDEAGLSFFQDLQKGMADSLPELEAQLDLFYTETVSVAFGTIDLAATKSATELAATINNIKQQLLDSGNFTSEEEVDKYIDKYLSGIDSINQNVDKINIAKKLAKQFSNSEDEVDQIFDELIEKLDTFNDSELAYLSIHLNDQTLDKELDKWIEKHSDIISAFKEQGASTTFKNTLSGYNDKTGFTDETIEGLYTEGSSTASYLPSKEDFQMADVADQYDLITQAMIKSTKEAVKHKDTVVQTLTDERTELETWQGVYNAASKTAEAGIQSLVENNKQIKDDYEEIYQLAVHLADGTEELSGTEAALLSKLEQLGIINEKQLKDWGEKIVRAKENQKAISNLTSEIEKADKTEIDYKNNITELNKTMSLHSKVMDDIQTVYSNLTGMIDDYKETGHWTIDNVQKLIEMDDKYVATLEMENGTLSLNEESFQKLSLAKIDDMRVTILNTAYQKLLAIANKDVSDEALKAADAVVQSALAIAEAQGAAEDAIPSLEALADKLAEIRGANGADSNYTKAAENVYKAAKNELAALDDVASQIGKGGDAMKKALHTGKDSKSSSKDKDKELKKLEEEFDRYWEIHKALDQIDRDLKKLNKDQENLYGKELIRSLKQENQLLENQAQLYEQLAAAQQAEAEELRGKLALSGVVFDASGAVINYAEATAAALKAYNDAVQAYNAGLLNDAAFKIHEKAFEEFKKNLERYDTLFYQEMKETQEKLDDIRREMLANNLKAWEVEIQLKLDFKQLERDWNDFIHEVTEDFQSVFKDLRVDLKNMLDDAKTYIGKDGDISTIIKAVKDVTKEIDKMMGGGESDMFESVSQAQEKLKELNQQLLDAGKSLHDLYKEAYENLLDGIDQVADKFDMLMEQLERINDEIEFQKKLIELLYGDEAYDKMSEYYAAVENNTLAQLDSLKKQTDMWKEEFEASGATMDNFENWSTEQQKLYEKWVEAQKKLDDMTLEYVELLQNDYLNTIKDIVSQLDKFMTGSTMSKMQEQWEKIKKDSERYYDNVEGAYHIQTLANKIDQSIVDAGSLQAQEKLMALRDKEINYLREKKNLTEYDIQAADLRYQLALREIALENAQNNKNSMKLTRNEEGNWSYQYVADEEDVASKRQELLDTYYQLYELADKAYTENIERGIELQEWYDEKVNEISEKYKNDQEKLEEELTALKLEFEEKRRLIAAETAEYQEQLTTAGAGVVWTVYLQDEENYKTMTDNEREMVRKLIENNISDYMGLEEAITNNYNNIGTVAKDTITETREDWNSAAAEMIARWYTDDDSVRAEVERAYQAIIDANNKYQEAVDICAEVVGRDFDNISDALKNAQDETDNLKDKTAEMVQESHGYLSELRGYVNEIAEAWRSVQQEIMNTINLIDQYLRKVGEANAAAQQQAQTGAGGTGGGSGGTGEGKEKGGTPSGGESWDALNNATGAWSRGIASSRSGAIAWASARGNVTSVVDADHYVTYTPKSTSSSSIQLRNGGVSSKVSNVNLLTPYASGGYTGSWGDDSGKLAVLHQKELVLNADDTKNFLSGINMIRQLSSGLNGSIENAVLKAVANTALSLGGITSHPSLGSTVSNNSSTDNIFNITAEFPNANNVDDIRQAILSLPNVASQYINSNLR